MRPRWWQWSFGFGKERIKDGRGCFDGGYPYWILEISIGAGRYRFLPPLRLVFEKWSKRGNCLYELVIPPYDWQIEYPWSPYFRRRLMKRGVYERLHWWERIKPKAS